MAPSFSSQEDAVLIEQIKKNAALYDQNNKDYKDLVIKENIWNLIATTLGRTNEDCKTRWKHMRDNYFKLKRKQKKNRYSAIRPTKWPLFRHLTFLNNAKQERRSSSSQELREDSPINDTSEIVDVGNEDVKSESLCSQKRKNPNGTDIGDWCIKRPRTDETAPPETPDSRTQSLKPAVVENLEGQSKQRFLPEMPKRPEEDDVDLFMKSVAIVVKRMSPYSIARAKTDILATVTKLQFPTSSQSGDENESERSSLAAPTEVNCSVSTPVSPPPRNPLENEIQ